MPRLRPRLSVRVEACWYQLDGVCAGEMIAAVLYPGGVTELCFYAINPPTRLSARKDL